MGDVEAALAEAAGVPRRRTPSSRRPARSPCSAEAALIDLHTHLLPGIDDGPATMSDSVELARQLWEDGTRGVAATPHCRPDHPRVHPQELAGLAPPSWRTSCARSGIELGRGARGRGGPRVGARSVRRGAARGELQGPRQGPARGDPLRTAHHELRDAAVPGSRSRATGSCWPTPSATPPSRRTPSAWSGWLQAGTLLQVTASALIRPPRTSRSAKLARRPARGRPRPRAGLRLPTAPPPRARRHSRRAPGWSPSLVGNGASRLDGGGRCRARSSQGEPLPEPPPIEGRPTGMLARLRRS